MFSSKRRPAGTQAVSRKVAWARFARRGQALHLDIQGVPTELSEYRLGVSRPRRQRFTTNDESQVVQQARFARGVRLNILTSQPTRG
jgi:hypothetical protein